MTKFRDSAVRGVPVSGWVAPTDDEVAALSDAALLTAVSELEEAGRQIDVAKARYSAEVARRSRRELGNAGLAAQQGFLSAENLLRSVTRTGRQEASRRIRMGALLSDAAAAGPGEPAPLSPVATAVLDGRLGLDDADQVLRALGPVVDEVDRGQLSIAVATLATEAAAHDADEMGAMARSVRDTLDRLGVLDRERQLRDQRALRRGPVVDGLRRVSMVLDPESDAIIMGAIEHAMSPRLGGPRFSHDDDKQRAGQLVDDPRTNYQLALDTLADLVRIGVDRDDGAVLGSSKPAVRVTIAIDDLTRAVDSDGVEHPDTDTGLGCRAGQIPHWALRRRDARPPAGSPPSGTATRPGAARLRGRCDLVNRCALKIGIRRLVHDARPEFGRPHHQVAGLRHPTGPARGPPAQSGVAPW